MGRGLIIALLVLSVALNVYILGVHSGRLLHGAFPHKPPHHEQTRFAEPESPFRMLRHAEELSPDSRDKFRDALRAGLPKVREDHQEKRRLRKELGELLSADQLDRQAIEAKMSEIQALETNQRELLNKAFLDALETLSADERRQLLKASDERRAKRRERFKKRMEDRRGPPPDDGPVDMPPPPEDE